MRKHLLFIFVMLFVFVATASKSASAESIKRANRKDVEMLLSAASSRNSAYWASYIGETRGRVYIEYETAVHAGSLFSNELKHVVYWLPRSEISNEQLARFKAYKNKYVPAK